MRSVPAAIVWEMWQRGKWSFLGAFLFGNAVPGLVLFALRQQGALDPDERAVIVMHVTLIFINSVVFGAAVLSALGQPSRLYAYPVRASTIAVWHLLPAMAAVAIETLASTLTINAIFQLDWPLWGPALFMAVGLATFMACMWFTEKSPWHYFVLDIPVMAVVGFWFYSRYGLVVYSGQPRLWSAVTPAEGLTMLATAACACYVAVVGIGRGRSGEFLKTPRFFHWVGRLFDAAPAVGLPFGTPARAQFWFEWRQKGWAMPAEVVIFLLVAFCGWVLFSRAPQDLFDGCLSGGAFLALGALLVGLFMGNSGPSDGKLEMGNFLATRPMTNTAMSRTMLKSAGISLGIAWLLWALSLLVVYVILQASRVVPAPHLPVELGWRYFPATLAGAWLAVSLPATLGQAGRQMLFMVFFCGSMGLMTAGILLSNFVPEARSQLLHYGPLAASAVFVAATIWSFVAARRRSLIGPPTVYAAGAAWAVLSAVVFAEGVRQPAGPLPVSILIVGLLALAVAPLAAAPLALEWNRHR